MTSLYLNNKAALIKWCEVTCDISVGGLLNSSHNYITCHVSSRKRVSSILYTAKTCSGSGSGVRGGGLSTSQLSIGRSVADHGQVTNASQRRITNNQAFFNGVEK